MDAEDFMEGYLSSREQFNYEKDQVITFTPVFDFVDHRLVLHIP